MNDEAPSKGYLLLLGCYVLIAAYFRLKGLDRQSLWLDELWIMNWVLRDSFLEAIQGGTNVGGGSIMSGFGISGEQLTFHLFTLLLGNSDWAIRFPSAIAGIVLVFIVAEFGRRIHGESTGLIAGGMQSTSLLAISYSQEARFYMIGTTLMWLSLLEITNGEKKSIPRQISVIGMLSFAFVTHHLCALSIVIALFVLCIQAVTSKIRQSGWAKLFTRQGWSELLHSDSGMAIRTTIVILIVAILGIPKMLKDSESNAHATWISHTPDDPHIHILRSLFGYPSYGTIVDGLSELMWIIILLSPLVMALTMRMGLERRPIEQQPEWLLWMVGIGSLVAVVTYSSIVRPLFVIRYLLFSTPAWFLLIALTIQRMFTIAYHSMEKKRGETAVWSACASLSLMLLFASITWLLVDYDYYNQTTKSDFRSVAEEINRLDPPIDAYIVTSPNPSYWNVYLAKMESDERVDFGRYSYIGSPAFSEISINQPSMVIYALGHNPDRLYDEEFVGFLSSDYVLTSYESYYMAEIHIFEIKQDDT